MDNWNKVSGEPYVPITNASETHCLNFTSTVRKFAHVARPTVAGLGALASLLGIFVIIGIMIKNKKYRTFYYRLILYLIISTLCVGITQAFTVLPLNEDYKDVHVKEGGWEGACEAIGYFSEMSAWLEHMAIAWITVYIILTVLNCPKIKHMKEKIMKKCEVVGFLVWLLTPILLCWIPFTTRSYGLSGLWCWIKSTNEDCSEVYISGVIFQFLLYYVPFLVLVLFNISTLFIIFCHFCRNYCKNRDVYKKTLKLVISYCIYPLVYDIFFAIAFANRISYAYAVSHKKNPNYGLWIAHSIVESGRCLYPPFILLVVSAISYFYGRCTRQSSTQQGHIAADLHASHHKSTKHTRNFSNSETFYEVPTEFPSHEEQDDQQYTNKSCTRI